MEIFMKVRTKCRPLVLLLVLLALLVGCGENNNAGNETAASGSNGTTVTDTTSGEVSTKEPVTEAARIDSFQKTATNPKAVPIELDSFHFEQIQKRKQGGGSLPDYRGNSRAHHAPVESEDEKGVENYEEIDGE
jgi:ABC-type glycerol-3-phosphate transport system substrate-binding protein